MGSAVKAESPMAAESPAVAGAEKNKRVSKRNADQMLSESPTAGHDAGQKPSEVTKPGVDARVGPAQPGLATLEALQGLWDHSTLGSVVAVEGDESRLPWS